MERVWGGGGVGGLLNAASAAGVVLVVVVFIGGAPGMMSTRRGMCGVWERCVVDMVCCDMGGCWGVAVGRKKEWGAMRMMREVG